jgi:prophage regulatory protein
MKNEYPLQDRFLRLCQVTQMIGLSRTKIYDMQAKMTFPHSIQLGGRAVAWLEADVRSWMAGRVKAAH